ncbi:hypothetical protein M758_UG248000 [Ceratodon purpureus]|nr:hypothetical protein M758_UG248000 [Ceratodon purpureus]
MNRTRSIFEVGGIEDLISSHNESSLLRDVEEQEPIKYQRRKNGRGGQLEESDFNPVNKVLPIHPYDYAFH